MLMPMDLTSLLGSSFWIGYTPPKSIPMTAETSLD
jgi:hypothetical protein